MKFTSLAKVNKDKEWRITYLLGECEWDGSSHGKYTVSESRQSRFLILVLLKGMFFKLLGDNEYICKEGSVKI